MLWKCFGLSNGCERISGRGISNGEFYNAYSLCFCIICLRQRCYLGLQEVLFKFLERKALQRLLSELRRPVSDSGVHITWQRCCGGASGLCFAVFTVLSTFRLSDVMVAYMLLIWPLVSLSLPEFSSCYLNRNDFFLCFPKILENTCSFFVMVTTQYKSIFYLMELVLPLLFWLNKHGLGGKEMISPANDECGSSTTQNMVAVLFAKQAT